MKTALVIFAAAVAVATAQSNYVDPRQAAILAEARYLSGDGSFGSAYTQEDGTDFKEETSADGTRTGQYSYIDPNGMKITVKYTAGKNGFQVSGDHLPKAPAPLPVPAPQAPRAPVQQRYQQPAVPQLPQQAYNPVPQYNAQPQYNSIPNAAGAPKQQFAYSFGTDNNNNFQNFGNYLGQNQFAAPQQPFVPTTTQAPANYFPAGKLNLNRTPDGFQYSFSSQ